MTSARLCTDDQDGAEPTSASASRITSGGASMTTSRDACTATNNNDSNAATFADQVARQSVGRPRSDGGELPIGVLSSEPLIHSRAAVSAAYSPMRACERGPPVQ